MSVQGRVGQWEFVWKSVPRGPVGTALVEVRAVAAKGAGQSSGQTAGKLIEIRWRRDADGIWLELPSGVHGFDLESEAGDDGRPQFYVSERGGARAWQGLSYLHAGEEQAVVGVAGAKKNVRVRAQMPGKILRLNLKAGDSVEKGQTILVMEAMKMENEIRAPQAGKIGLLKVAEGQAVETGADLCVIEQ